jgi:hypothetical protein
MWDNVNFIKIDVILKELTIKQFVNKKKKI